MSLSIPIFGFALLALVATAQANALRLKPQPTYAASAELQYDTADRRNIATSSALQSGFSGAFSARQTAHNLGYSS